MAKKNWKYFDKFLPDEKQDIIVYDEGQKKELKRIFYLKFWQEHKRILDCTMYCYKWRAEY